MALFNKKVTLDADQYSELRNELAQIIAADFKATIGSQIITAKEAAFESRIMKAAETEGKRYAEQARTQILRQFQKWEKDQPLRQEIDEVKRTQANFQTEMQKSMKEIMSLLQALMSGQEKPEKNQTLEEILERLDWIEKRLNSLEQRQTSSPK